MTEPIIFEPMLGDHISKVADQLVKLASAADRPAQAKFNDMVLVATPGMTTADLCRWYDDECKRLSEAYRNSPEGKASALRAADEVRRLQAEADSLVVQLPSLDFADLSAVFAWICLMQEASDHMGVVIPAAMIIDTFATHGYESNVNLGDAFDASDRDNVARYIIGQAINHLGSVVGAIHPMVIRFADDWRRKFEGEESRP